MEAFFCIVLGTWAISAFLKHLDKKKPEQEYYQTRDISAVNLTADEIDQEMARQKQQAERNKEAEELKKQGYSDELIAIIIPTINNGQ